jgi:hypothetical protein
LQDGGGFRTAVVSGGKVAGDDDCKTAVIADAKVAGDGDCMTVVIAGQRWLQEGRLR